MGNRAVLTTAPYKGENVGIYVHWNGDEESVSDFLDTCRERGHRDPTVDVHYAMARLCEVCCQFFGGSLSVGIAPCNELDTEGDNGVYLIGADWRIVGRMNN